MSRPCPSCGAHVPADTTFCPECSAYVAWEEEADDGATAESPRRPGEQAPPPSPPPDATTPMEPVEPDVVDCPSCGELNPASRSLCQRCGTSLHAAAAPPQPPAVKRSTGSRRGLWVGVGLVALLGLVALGVVLLGGDDGEPEPFAASPTAATSPDPSPQASPEPTPEPSLEPTPEPSPEPSPTVEEPTEPPFFANTEPDTEEPAGAGTVEQITVSRHPGYDEVVFAVDGPGVGWVVEYVEEPRLQGSGRPVDVAGDTVLRVLLRQVGPLEDGLGEVRPTGTSAIDELVEGTWFEGQLGVFVGLDGPQRPFRMIPDEDGGALLQIDTTGTG